MNIHSTNLKDSVEKTNSSLHNPIAHIPREFFVKLKIGVYKELCGKELLAKEQLDALIALQKGAGVFEQRRSK